MKGSCFLAFLLSLCVLCYRTSGQQADPQFQLKLYEDSLQALSDTILDGKEQGVRQNACYDFIKMLVRALKVEDSFNYPFDSLNRISILYPLDKSFRIFNWQLPYTSGTQRYFGAIQMNEKKLKLYPLFDYSDNIKDPADTVTNNERWYGALYYKILDVKSKGKKYYMLFGWDGNTIRSSKKLLDVLWFDKEKQPMFGANLFYFDNEQRNNIKRFIIEYKKDAQVSLNYDDELKMIMFDHLIPQDPSTEGLYFTYVPDGSYEAFQWKKGKWNYVENVFTSTLKEPPFPKPVDFDKKKIDRR